MSKKKRKCRNTPSLIKSKTKTYAIQKNEVTKIWLYNKTNQSLKQKNANVFKTILIV